MPNINLLPWREELKEERRREFMALLGLFACASCLVALVVHLFVSSLIQDQKNRNIYLNNEIKILDKKLEEIAGLQKEKERLLARMKIIQQLQANRPMIVRVLDGLVRTLPDGLYLDHLARKNNQVLMEGRAESNSRVSRFMRNIENFDWLQQPSLSVIQANNGESENMHRFILRAHQANPLEKKNKEQG